MTRKRWGFLVLFVVLAGGLYLAGRTRIYRTFFGITTIQIQNDSSNQLQDLVLILRCGTDAGIRETMRTIPPRSTVTFRRRCSDLFVQDFEFKFEKRAITYRGGAMATRGETLVFVIKNDESVKLEYR